MSASHCYIEKHLFTDSSSDFYHVTQDPIYNGIFNGVIWNLTVSSVVLFVGIFYGQLVHFVVILVYFVVFGKFPRL
jgi:hypothetical protein